METVLSVGSAPRLYNEDPRPAEIKLKESLEMVVELLRRDGSKGIRLCKEDFMCDAVTMRLVDIHCQETTSED
jgi:hypothetical protein